MFKKINDIIEGIGEARLFWLAALILLLPSLGVADLWTQEWRWADIVWRMRFSHDYFNPNLAGQAYYDKPLLSYWFMVLTTHVIGLNGWGLRLPSVVAGFIALGCVRRLARQLFDLSVAKLASWMLLTTYFFVFWSRVASADMLNVAGMLLAITWYYAHRLKTDFISYFGFFLIVAVFSLIKGPVVGVLSLIVVLTDSFYTKTLTRHLNIKLLSAILLSIAVYSVPFLVAHNSSTSENSFYLVYRENILRFFQPFDHQGAWYTYFLYLPLYLLPWSLVVPLLLSKKIKNKAMNTLEQRAFFISLWVMFVFFTLSGSRRSYYILPMVSLVVMSMAFYVRSVKEKLYPYIAIIYALLLLWFVLFPVVYYRSHGIQVFSAEIKRHAEEIKPWSSWQVIMVQADDRVGFYLQSARPPQSYRAYTDVKDKQSLWQASQIVVVPSSLLPQLKKDGLPAGARIVADKATFPRFLALIL